MVADKLHHALVGTSRHSKREVIAHRDGRIGLKHAGLACPAH